VLVIEGPARRWGVKASRRRCVPRDRRRRLHRRDRSINRLESPTARCIRFGGIDVTRLSGDEPARRGAMIFQQFNLVDRLDVLTHVLMGRLNHTPTLRTVLQFWSDEDKAFTFTALEPFDIASLAARVDSLVAYRGSIRLFGRIA
jgi:ABC-type branched-subunit amino acid transport system ATPase component